MVQKNSIMLIFAGYILKLLRPILRRPASFILLAKNDLHRTGIYHPIFYLLKQIMTPGDSKQNQVVRMFEIVLVKDFYRLLGFEVHIEEIFRDWMVCHLLNVSGVVSLNHWLKLKIIQVFKLIKNIILQKINFGFH